MTHKENHRPSERPQRQGRDGLGLLDSAARPGRIGTRRVGPGPAAAAAHLPFSQGSCAVFLLEGNIAVGGGSTWDASSKPGGPASRAYAAPPPPAPPRPVLPAPRSCRALVPAAPSAPRSRSVKGSACEKHVSVPTVGRVTNYSSGRRLTSRDTEAPERAHVTGLGLNLRLQTSKPALCFNPYLPPLPQRRRGATGYPRSQPQLVHSLSATCLEGAKPSSGLSLEFSRYPK